MLTRNMNVSTVPMSAWNLSGATIHVATPRRQGQAGEHHPRSGGSKRPLVGGGEVEPLLQMGAQPPVDVDPVVHPDPDPERHHRQGGDLEPDLEERHQRVSEQ